MPDEAEADGGQPPSHAFWSGNIAFGLVSIPVVLLVASRAGGVPLRLVDAEGALLRRRYFCSRDGQPLRAEDIVRGYEVEDQRYVTVDDAELEALAPAQSREIDLKRFVPLCQIDPVYFERAYFLAPDRGALKAYRLLARTLEDARRAGIATFVMRGKEYLIAIIGEQGLLRAETLRFHDELRTPAWVGLPPLQAPDDAARIEAVERAMRDLSAPDLDSEDLRDPQRARLMEIIQRKLESRTDVVAAAREEEEEPAEGAEIIDLMQILKQSLQGEMRGPPSRAAGGGRSAGREGEESRDELYRRARELGIQGRSHMSKEALAEAIRNARR